MCLAKFLQLSKHLHQWLRYRAALSLLRQLSTRELAELHLSPADMRNLARKICRRTDAATLAPAETAMRGIPERVSP